MNPEVIDTNPERTKKLRLASRVLVVVTGLVWAIYDVLPSVNGGRGDTISENLRDWSRTLWVLPFFWGALSSHLFLNVGQHPVHYRTLFYALACLTLFLLGANLFSYFGWDWVAPLWFRGLVFVVGLVLGMLLWGQNS